MMELHSSNQSNMLDSSVEYLSSTEIVKRVDSMEDGMIQA